MLICLSVHRIVCGYRVRKSNRILSNVPFNLNRIFVAGIRALDHCVEQQYRPNATVPSRALAREGAGTLFESLRACYRNSTDVEARQRALIGVWMSLWSDSLIAGLGPSHSLGYEIGSP